MALVTLSWVRAIECAGPVLSHLGVHAGRCECWDGFYGDVCQFKDCPKQKGVVCAAQGVCVEAKGQCVCRPGYEGTACEHTKCPVSSSGDVCGGHARGACDQTTGACYCEIGFWGEACLFGSGLDPNVVDL